MPISHKIRQYRALLGFAHPGRGSLVCRAGLGKWHSGREYGGVYAPNSCWLSSWGLGIGLLEQSSNLSLVVPWFDVSLLFWL